MKNPLFKEYLLEKFVKELDRELYLSKFAKLDMPDVPWWKPYWWRVQEYCSSVWRALKGQCFCDCGDWDD